MRARYTLTYKAPAGYIALVNLGEYAARQIKEAQEHLGSTDIRLQRQGHWYANEFLSLLLQREQTSRLSEGDINIVRSHVGQH